MDFLIELKYFSSQPICLKDNYNLFNDLNYYSYKLFINVLLLYIYILSSYFSYLTLFLFSKKIPNSLLLFNHSIY